MKKDKWPPMRLTKQQYEKMSDEEKKEWVKAMEESGKEILSEEKLEGETNEEFFKRVTGIEDTHEAKKKYFQKIAARAGIGDTGVRDGEVDENLKKVVFGNAAHMQAGTEYDKKKEVLENKKNKVENKREKKEVERILSDSGILEKIVSYKNWIKRGKDEDAAQYLIDIKFKVQELNLSEDVKKEIIERMGIKSLKFSDEEVEEYITQRLGWAGMVSFNTEFQNLLNNYVDSLEKKNSGKAEQEYKGLEKMISSLPAGKIKADLAGKVLEVLETKGEIDALKIDKDGNLVRDELLKGGEAERFKNLNTELIQAKAEIKNLKEEKINEEDGRVENSPENEDDGSGEKDGGSTTSTTTTTAPAPESVVVPTPAQPATPTETPTAGAGEQATTSNSPEQAITSPEQTAAEGVENVNGGAETTPTSPENQSQGQESVENLDQLTLGERINQRIGVLSAQLEKVENALANIQEGEEIELILDGEKQNFTKERLEAKQKELQEKIEILEKRLELWNEKERVSKNLENIEKVLKENKGEDLEKKVSVEIDGEEKEMTLAELYRLKGSLKEEKAGLLTQNMDAYNQKKDLEVKGFWGELWNKVSNWKLVKEWQGMSKTRKLWWSFALGTSAATLAFPTATSLSFLAILGKSAGIRAGTMMSAWMGSETGRVLADSYIDNGLKKLKKKELWLRSNGDIEEADILKKKIEKKEEHKGRWVIAGSIIAGALAGWGGHSLGNSLVGAGSSTPEVKNSVDLQLKSPVNSDAIASKINSEAGQLNNPVIDSNASIEVAQSKGMVVNTESATQQAVESGKAAVTENEGFSQNISANESPTETPKVSSVDNSFLQSDLTPEQQEIATQYESIQQVNHGIDEIGKMGTIQIQENDWTDLDKIFEKEFPNLSKPERANLVENVLAHEGVFDGNNLDMERVSEVLKEPMKGYSNLVMRAEGLSAENQQALMDKYFSLIDKIDNQDGVKIEQEHILNSPHNDVSDWGQNNSPTEIYNENGLPNKEADMTLSTDSLENNQGQTKAEASTVQIEGQEDPIDIYNKAIEKDDLLDVKVPEELLDQNGLQKQPISAPESVEDILKMVTHSDNSKPLSWNGHTILKQDGNISVLDKSGDEVALVKKSGFLQTILGHSQKSELAKILDNISQGKNIG